MATRIWRTLLPAFVTLCLAAWTACGPTEASGAAPDDEASLEAELLRVETAEGISSEALVAPLTGLGAINAARGRHESAIGYWQRAIAVLRRADGLFTPRQLPLLDDLSASWLALADPLAALEVRRYALVVAERSSGEDDPRTLPAIEALIAVHEQLDEHEQVRRQYAHMRRVGLREGDPTSPTVIRALLGIGRSHLRQFVEEPTSVQPHWIRDPVTGEAVPQMSLEPYQSPRPDRAGRHSTAEALALLRGVEDPPPGLLTSALIESGDWQIALQRPQHAVARGAGRHEGAADQLERGLDPPLARESAGWSGLLRAGRLGVGSDGQQRAGRNGAHLSRLRRRRAERPHDGSPSGKIYSHRE